MLVDIPLLIRGGIYGNVWKYKLTNNLKSKLICNYKLLIQNKL